MVAFFRAARQSRPSSLLTCRDAPPGRLYLSQGDLFPQHPYRLFHVARTSVDVQRLQQSVYVARPYAIVL